MWPRPERSRLPVASGFAAFLTGLVAGLAPAPEMDVNAWAAEERVVSAESGSPQPGRWNSSLTPYLNEVHAVMGSAHPARDVVVVKSAQTGFSEAGLNMIGASIDLDPCPILVVLPTVDEAKKYNRIKLQPTIESTPALRRKVRAHKDRSADSSTTLNKGFDRGFLVLTGANSSSGLQMISARKIVFEEVSEYPVDAGDRGDPVEQALARSKAWLSYKPKRYYVATPGLKGACRVTAKYEESDQRRYYVPCPQCGAYQVLLFRNLRWSSEVRPHGAYFVCAANGCIIEPHMRRSMISRGVWLKTYKPAEEEAAENPEPPETIEPEQLDRWRNRPAGSREPGFHIWQAYSPFVDWDDTVNEWLTAQGKPLRLRVFWQQALGEAWEDSGEAPAAERLFEARESFAWRRVPNGAQLITAMVDVQADRLEYGVYAWSRSIEHGWHIDGGVIEGDPATDTPWSELDKVLARQYEDGRGCAWDIDGFGVDAGYLSNRVYMWANRHAMPRQAREPHNPATTRHVFALDGRPGWKLPWVGLPSTRQITFDGKKWGAVRLWPTATFELKYEIYTALRNLIKGPDDEGRRDLPMLHYTQQCDRAFFDQLTAEYMADKTSPSGVTTKIWVNPAGKRNEQLDIAVGARALAHHFADSLTTEDWESLASRRAQGPQAEQGTFAELFEPSLGMPSGERRSPAQPAPAPAPERNERPTPAPSVSDAGDDDWLGGRGEGWFD